MTEQEVLEKLNIFKNALVKKNDEIKGLNEQIEKLQKSYNEKQIQFETVATSLQDKEIIKTELEKKISQLEETLKTQKAEIQTAQDNSEKYIEENKSLQSKIDEISKELMASTEALENIKKKVDDDTKTLQRRNSEEAFNKNKTISILEEKVKTLTNEKTILKEKVDFLEQDSLVKNDLLSKKDEEILSLQKKIDEEITAKSSQLSDNINNFRKLLSLKDDSINQLKAELIAANEKIVNLTETLKIKENDISIINKKFEEQGFVQHTEVTEENVEDMKIALEKIKTYNENKNKDQSDIITTDSEDNETYSNSGDLIYYRFGHTHSSIKDQLVKFINELYNGINDTHSPYELNNINSAAARAKISNKTKNVFVKRLYEMSNSGKSLIYNKENILYSDFTRDFLIDFTTAIVR